MGGNEQQFCLRWNNHQSTLVSVFEALLESETLVDVTLAAEGRYLKAHKVVLCACSPFFQDLLSNHLEKYPIIVLKDVTFQELKALIDYMYRGEVNVSQEQLAALIKTAESLKIKGLADGGDKNKKSTSSNSNTPAASSPAPPPPPSLPAPLPPSAPASIETHSPINNIREGSTSPVSRKRRKRSRRRSGDSLEPESVESSLSEPPLAVEREETTKDERPPSKERVIRALGLVPPSALLSQSAAAAGLLEPKAEVEDIDEESVDLMLDEDVSQDHKGSARDLDARPGPSHEGLQSAAGFPPWHLTPERGGGGDDLSISAVGPEGGGGAASAAGSHENRVYSEEEMASLWDDATVEEMMPVVGVGGGGEDSLPAILQQSSSILSMEQQQGFVCPDCGRCYQRQRSLQRHRRYECGVEKRFTCQICWKNFKRPDQLHKHQKIHKNFDKDLLEEILEDSTM